MMVPRSISSSCIAASMRSMSTRRSLRVSRGVLVIGRRVRRGTARAHGGAPCTGRRRVWQSLRRDRQGARYVAAGATSDEIHRAKSPGHEKAHCVTQTVVGYSYGRRKRGASMLRIRMALTGMFLKVAAPVAATLIAALVFGSLPKANVPAAQPVVQLTSGGKFAARIPDAGAAAQQDGVDAAHTNVPTGAEAAQLPGTSYSAGEAGKLSAAVDMAAALPPAPSQRSAQASRCRPEHAQAVLDLLGRQRVPVARRALTGEDARSRRARRRGAAKDPIGRSDPPGFAECRDRGLRRPRLRGSLGPHHHDAGQGQPGRHHVSFRRQGRPLSRGAARPCEMP